jgi:hypothetical protein
MDVQFLEVSGSKVQLQLDTGAKTPELFPVSHDAHPSQPWGGSMATSSGANDVIVHSNITLRIGATTVPGQDVVQSRRAVAFDAAGLSARGNLPENLYQPLGWICGAESRQVSARLAGKTKARQHPLRFNRLTGHGRIPEARLPLASRLSPWGHPRLTRYLEHPI